MCALESGRAGYRKKLECGLNNEMASKYYSSSFLEKKFNYIKFNTYQNQDLLKKKW